MSGDTWYIVIMLGITALLIATNALFVFHEFAFVVLRPFHVRELSRRDSWLAQVIVKTAHRIDHYIAVDQLGITATSIAVGWLGQPVLTRLLRGPFENIEQFSGVVAFSTFAIAFSMLTILQMVLGELIPKTVALRHPLTVTSIVSIPVEVVAWLLHPLVVVLNGLGNLAVRAIGATPQTEGHQETLPAEELEVVIGMSAAAGRVQTDPLVLRRTLHFSDLEARDLIVPRQDMITVDLAMDLEAVLEIAKEHHFTRYPVSDGTADNIVGLLNVKDLFRVNSLGRPTVIPDWHDAIQPIPVLPEVASIEQTLQQLIDAEEQMALLVDEFGGTTGLLTISDIAAEATGSSQDITPLPTGWYLIAGESAVSSVETILNLSLDTGRQDYETIAGLVMSVLGRIPTDGDEIEVNGATLRVHHMKGHRIAQIMLKPPAEKDVEG